MLWKDVLAILNSSPIVVLQQNCNPDYLFVEHLDRYDDAMSSDTLYFATLSTLLQWLTKAAFSGAAVRRGAARRHLRPVQQHCVPLYCGRLSNNVSAPAGEPTGIHPL